MSKLLCSFGVGFNSVFYGTFYFVKGPIKTVHHTLRFDWLFAVAVIRNWCSVKFRNIHRKTSVLVSLFDKVVDLEACNFIKKWLRKRCLPANIAKFLKSSFFLENLRWLLICLLEIEKKKKAWENFFKWKRKNENLSFIFYLQVLVLVISEMQIQLHQYYNLTFPSYFLFKFYFFRLLLTNWHLSHLLVHSIRSRLKHGWKVQIATLQNNYISCTVVNGCFQSFI